MEKVLRLEEIYWRQRAGKKEITDHIVNYYKTLFGAGEPCQMSLKPDFWPQHLKLSDSDKVDLVKGFGMQEIKDVIIEMKVTSALVLMVLGFHSLKISGKPSRMRHMLSLLTLIKVH